MSAATFDRPPSGASVARELRELARIRPNPGAALERIAEKAARIPKARAPRSLADALAWHEALGHFQTDREREAFRAGFRDGSL